MLFFNELQRRPGRSAEVIFCATGIIGSGSLLVASRLSHFWLTLDALTHFTLHLLIVGGASFVGLFVPRGRSLTVTVLSLVGFLSIGGYSHYLSAYLGVMNSLQPGEGELGLMTFNTSVINRNTDAIVAELHRLDPDLAIMMEFSEKKYGVLEQTEQAYPYTAGCVPQRHCHFAVFSKIPISSVQVREGWNGPLMVRIALGGEFAGLTIIGVHFARVPNVKSQFEELAVFLNYLKGVSGPMVVMGDFNATLFSGIISVFEDQTRMVRLSGVPTWPAFGQLPQFGIDHIFTSRQIRQLDRTRIGRPAGSDHFPLFVSIAMPKP